MLRSLFARLTRSPPRGRDVFALATRIARTPEWYTRAQVEDSIEGRFRVLATIVALFVNRLEQGGESGENAAVAITERFIEAMDSELRQMGVGDPALGKQVRSMVGALATRNRLLGEADPGSDNWTGAADRSLHHRAAPSADASRYGATALADLRRRLQATEIADLTEGRLQ